MISCTLPGLQADRGMPVKDIKPGQLYYCSSDACYMCPTLILVIARDVHPVYGSHFESWTTYDSATEGGASRTSIELPNMGSTSTNFLVLECDLVSDCPI